MTFYNLSSSNSSMFTLPVIEKKDGKVLRKNTVTCGYNFAYVVKSGFFHYTYYNYD